MDLDPEISQAKSTMPDDQITDQTMEKPDSSLKQAPHKKVLFVVLTKLRDEGNAGNFKDLPYGILSIIKHNEHIADFDILDLLIDDDEKGEWVQEITRRVEQTSPDIVGISVMFDNAYDGIKPASEAVKNINSDIAVLLGGPAVSPAAKNIMRMQPHLDAVCFSEGERPVEHVLQADDIITALEEHPSWVSRKDLDTDMVPQKCLLQNLDGVADIPFGLVDVKEYESRASFNPLIDDVYDESTLKLFPVITSRGCPFKCAFCWHSGENDPSMRYASLDSIIEHIRGLIDNYGVNAISIYDDMLLLPRKRAKELFRRLAEFDLRVELPNGLSPTYMDEELIQLMQLAGVKSVRIAIESGDEDVLRNLINKPLKVNMVKPVVELLKKYEIWIVGFFVVGMPGETDEQRQTTINLIREWGIDLSSISVASPSKGSLLYQQSVKNGYIPDDEAEFMKSGILTGEGVISTPEFSAEEIAHQAYLMNLDVNFVNNSRAVAGDLDIAIKYMQYICKTYSQHAFGNYFLAAHLEKTGKHEAAQKYYQRTLEICQEDPKWLEYFDHFQIDPHEKAQQFLEIAE